MSPRKTMALIALLCVAAVTQLPAQQIAADSARVAPAAASTVQVSAPSTTLPAGPRLAPRYERVEPTVTSSDAPRGLALAPQTGGNTIVISTVGLLIVLLIVILVL